MKVIIEREKSEAENKIERIEAFAVDNLTREELEAALKELTDLGNAIWKRRELISALLDTIYQPPGEN